MDARFKSETLMKRPTKFLLEPYIHALLQWINSEKLDNPITIGR